MPTVDDAELNYLSTWDIDQLVTEGTTSVSTGNNTVYTSINTSTPNVFEVQYSPDNIRWFNPGTNASNLSPLTLFTFYAYVLNSNLVVNVTANGTVRYYIWTDKINY